MYFQRFLLRFVIIYKGLLDILGTYTFQSTFQWWRLLQGCQNRYSFPKRFLYICRTRDYGLRKAKMFSVLNVNLVVLKWQNIHVISNINYTRNIQQNLAKLLTLHSAEANSELCQTSGQSFYPENSEQFSLVNYFGKKLHFTVAVDQNSRISSVSEREKR